MDQLYFSPSKLQPLPDLYSANYGAYAEYKITTTQPESDLDKKTPFAPLPNYLNSLHSSPKHRNTLPYLMETSTGQNPYPHLEQLPKTTSVPSDAQTIKKCTKELEQLISVIKNNKTSIASQLVGLRQSIVKTVDYFIDNLQGQLISQTQRVLCGLERRYLQIRQNSKTAVEDHLQDTYSALRMPRLKNHFIPASIEIALRGILNLQQQEVSFSKYTEIPVISTADSNPKTFFNLPPFNFSDLQRLSAPSDGASTTRVNRHIEVLSGQKQPSTQSKAARLSSLDNNYLKRSRTSLQNDFSKIASKPLYQMPVSKFESMKNISDNNVVKPFDDLILKNNLYGDFSSFNYKKVEEERTPSVPKVAPPAGYPLSGLKDITNNNNTKPKRFTNQEIEEMLGRNHSKGTAKQEKPQTYYDVSQISKQNTYTCVENKDHTTMENNGMETSVYALKYTKSDAKIDTNAGLERFFRL